MVNAFTGTTFVGGKSDEMITRSRGAAVEEAMANARVNSVRMHAPLKPR